MWSRSMVVLMLLLLILTAASAAATGSDLEMNEDACEPALCDIGDDCYTVQPDPTTSPPEWNELPLGPCEPNPCHNGGVCESTDARRGEIFLGYFCLCSPGYTGVRCQHNVNECESGPCQNGGVCRDLEANYMCVCPGEYRGRNCQHRCSGPLGMEGGIISDKQLSASSVDSTLFGLHRWHPRLARLNKRGMVNAWSPAETDRWPWIQVNLQQRMHITAVITQGARRMGRPEFVKSFKVAHGSDGRTWRMVKLEGSTQDMIFHGNTDNSAPMANAFSPPIEAQYIRLYPQLCRGHCTLRMELMGCELTGCSEPLGLKSGQVLDSQLSASSVYRTLGLGLLSWGPEQARLDRKGKVNAWAAARNDQKQWIQVDLLAPTNITGVITQGARDFGRAQFVGSYKLAYSKDGISWTIYQDEAQHTDKVFQGNSDNDTHRKNYIEPPIYGRFLRLLPWSWYGRITLRMEILGCSEKE